MKVNQDTIVTRLYASPCGEMLLGDYQGRICFCEWATDERCNRLRRRFSKASFPDLGGFVNGETAAIVLACRELDEYFAAKRRTFDLPLLFAGTAFQKTVWNALSEIPYGATVSYQEVARRVGRPTAVRAVANAVGANSLSIIVPCHRVIGSDRSLTGYAGGTEAKNMLLRLEQALAPQ